MRSGSPAEDPGERVRLEYWGKDSRRDLKALAQHPVFGSRLEGTAHEGLLGRTPDTVITHLPGNASVDARVHRRANELLDALYGGGLGAADEAMGKLTALLGRPTTTALDGTEEALAGIAPVGPPARSLRAGLPEEPGWSALDEALAAFERSGEEVVGATST